MKWDDETFNFNLQSLLYINLFYYYISSFNLTVSTSNAQPKQTFTPDPTDYNAPMYKTGAHAGVLSIAGELSLT